ATRLRYAPTSWKALLDYSRPSRLGCPAGHLQGPGAGRYNLRRTMQSARYALVAYVRNAVGEFIENLRHELHPELPHLPAHVTILPPRFLQGSELAALELLEEICSRIEPFDVMLGNAETFVPVTPTVYIGLNQGAERLHQLHDRLNTDIL